MIRSPLMLWILGLMIVVLGSVIAAVMLDDTAGVVLAVVALVAALVAVLTVIRSELGEEEARPAARVGGVVRPVAVLGVLAAIVLGVAVGVGVIDSSSDATDKGSTTAAVRTARDFLTAALVDQDGDVACGYLTAAESNRIAAVSGGPCNAAFGQVIAGASGALGSERAIHDAATTTTRRDGRVTVVFGRGSGATTLTLRRTTPDEATEFQAPSSDWRIAAGAETVLAR